MDILPTATIVFLRSVGSSVDLSQVESLDFDWLDWQNDVAVAGPDTPASSASPAFDFDWLDESQADQRSPRSPSACSLVESRRAHPSSDADPGEVQAQAGDGGRDPLLVDTTAWLHVPGLQHILHNATECMGSTMLGWSSGITSLKSVCKLIRRTYSKERLRATCFAEEPHSLQWPLIDNFQGNVVDGRWASVSIAAVELCPLETPLRAAWSLEKFNFYRNGLPNDRPGDEHRLDSSALDSTLTSNYFWCYCFMVSMLS